MGNVRLLDERSWPDVRAVYGGLARDADFLDAAVSRVRLGGMTLGEGELGRIQRIRLLMAETNALALASEAEALAADPVRSRRLGLLAGLLEGNRLGIRISPLAGWSPDFSVFCRVRRGPPRETEIDADVATATLLIGPHWFERPYPHPGPAFVVLLEGEPALRARKRFDEAWGRGHDLRGPLLSLIGEALRRGSTGSGPELTPFGATGYSLPGSGDGPGHDPV
jgi:hypothetical protein